MNLRSLVLTSIATVAVAGGLAMPSAFAVPVTPVVTGQLSKASFAPGEARTLTVTENIPAAHTFAVTDSAGTTWTQTAINDTGATFTAPAPTVATTNGRVTVKMTRTWDSVVASDVESYTVVVPPPPPIAAWPGQQPGKLVLGMSCPAPCSTLESALGTPYGVRRQFAQWNNWSSVAATIDEDHAANRLPWVSIKGPGSNAAGWRALAAGSYNTELDSLATMLKAHDDKPVILTLHHEPSNDATEAEGKDWAAAYSYLHDRLKAQGALVNVADAPIVGDWLFNPQNKTQDPANWVTRDVLSRAPFLGIDLYENAKGDTFAQRIPPILSYMESMGFPKLQVGIGEFGGTDAAYPNQTAVGFINESLQWAVDHPDDIGVASYFNSTANSKEGVYWSLDESPAKLKAFQTWLNDPRVS